MFGSLFGAKESWEVEVTTPFVDVYVGMAHDEHFSKIPVGATGKASIKKNDNVTIVFDTLEDTPHDGALRIYCKKDDEVYNNFKWTEMKEDSGEENYLKKSNMFG